jgi:hypothetical protein
LKINRVEIEKIKFGSFPCDIDELAHKMLTREKGSTSSLLDYLPYLSEKAE